MYEKIVDMMVELFDVDRDDVSPDTTFESLDLDSLDLVEFAQAAEDELDVTITDDEAGQLKTVGDAARLMEAKTAGAQA